MLTDAVRVPIRPLLALADCPTLAFSSGAWRAGRSPAGDPRAEESAKFWKNLSLFVGLPAVLVATANAFSHRILGRPGDNEDFRGNIRKEDWDFEHHRPKFKNYSHLRIHTKAFPWGDGKHSFFHNSHVNPLPWSGYEEGKKGW